MTRDSRLKREAPERETGPARKGESDGADRQSPNMAGHPETPDIELLLERARESWSRILNMDGGQPQATAAGLWAALYAKPLLDQTTRLRTLPAPSEAMIEAVAFSIAPHLQRTTPINPDCDDVNAGRDYAMLVARAAPPAMQKARP